MADLIEHICTATTFHGVPDLYYTKNRFWKFSWFVIVVMSLSAMVFSSVEIFQQYYARPITTNVVINSVAESGLKFPVITICSVSFIEEKLVEKNNLGDVLRVITNAQNHPLELLLGTKSNHSATEHHRVPNSHKQDVAAYHISKIYDDVTYKTDEIILRCLFALKPCEGVVEIKRVYEAKYGTCFLLNTNAMQHVSERGLLLLIDSHASEMSTSDIVAEGISIRVQRTYNPLETTDLQAPTGFYCALSIVARHYKLVEYDGSCRNKNFTFNSQFFADLDYSMELCQKECLYDATYAKCYCVPAVYRHFLRDKSIEICHRESQLMCMAAVTSHEENLYSRCTSKCRPNCDYWEFSITNSLKRFPSRTTRPLVGSLLQLHNGSRLDDVLIVEFSLDQIRVSTIEQQFSITSEGFVSQIGGLLGLFMGGSLVSVVQIVIVILQHCHNPVQRQKKADITKKDTNSSTRSETDFTSESV